MSGLSTPMLAPLLVLAAVSGANASVAFTATLSNGQENPPALPLLTSTGASRPTSSGSATFLLNDAMTAISISATIANIDVTGSQTPDTNDNLLLGHLHASPTNTPTNNAPVVFGFFGVSNDTMPNDVVVTPFATGVGGTFTSKWDAAEGNNTTLAAQVPNLLQDRFYINFHTTQFPAGELRGNAVTAGLTPVPEPMSLALLGTGLTSLLGAGLRRSRRSA